MRLNFGTLACERNVILWTLLFLEAFNGVSKKIEAASLPVPSGAPSENVGSNRSLRGDLLLLEEAVTALLKEPESWNSRLNAGAQKFGLPSAIDAADKQISNITQKPVIKDKISILKADISSKRLVAESETPSADQAEYLRQLTTLAQRLDALEMRYSSVAAIFDNQRQSLGRWLLIWETEMAIEGEDEANKCLGRLLAKAHGDAETPSVRKRTNSIASQQATHFENSNPVHVSADNLDAAKNSAQYSSTVIVNGGRSGGDSTTLVKPRFADGNRSAGEQVKSQSKSFSALVVEERLVSLDEAVVIKEFDSGQPFYLTGEFVVTASAGNRAVLRSAQGGPASLVARIIVEYGAGFSAPPQGTTLLQKSTGRFVIMKVHRNKDGHVDVFVKDMEAK